MSLILDGTAGVTFNNSTVQASAGLVVGTASAITRGTAVASTSGTSIDFTGIPSWVKRVTVMFANVSTNGSSLPQIQVGNGTVVTSGYTGGWANMYANNSVQVGSNSSGFLISDGRASDVRSGQAVLTLISGNTWVCSLLIGFFLIDTSPQPGTVLSGGTIALGGTLDRVRITTVNGTDTFNAGSINILYE